MLPLCLKKTEENLNFEYQSQYLTIILRLMMLVNSKLTQNRESGYYTVLHHQSHVLPEHKQSQWSTRFAPTNTQSNTGSPVLDSNEVAEEAVRCTALHKVALTGEESFRILFSVFFYEIVEK